MMLVRNILGWVDDKTEEICENDDKHLYAKAFGLGAIEGAVDFMFVFGTIMYPIMLVRSVTKKKH